MKIKGRILLECPTSPFVDDLYLIEPDASSQLDVPPHPNHLNEDLLLLSRNDCFQRLLSSLRKREWVGPKLSTNTIALTSPQSTPSSETIIPPSAFLTVATITIQLAMLRQLSHSESSSALASATCESLLSMVAPMPIGCLRNLSGWESSVLLQISSVMDDLSKTSSSLQDAVKSLLLSFSIHRASLASILQVVHAIVVQNEYIHFPPLMLDLVNRMLLLPTPSPMVIQWENVERRFPVRRPRFPCLKAHYSMASSLNSDFLYLSTLGRILRIGTGDSRVVGSKPTVAGQVYASCEVGGSVVVLNGRVFTANREVGSSEVMLLERDAHSLEPLPEQSVVLKIPFKDHVQVEREVLLSLSGNDDKGGRTISFACPSSAWVIEGKAYFEVTLLDATDGGTLSIGWCDALFAGADNLRVGGGGDSHCWGVDVLGEETFANGVRQGMVTPYSSAFRVHDVVGCQVDVSGEGAKMTFFRNGQVFAEHVVLHSDIPTNRYRPVVSYSCDDSKAPQVNFGLFSQPFQYFPTTPSDLKPVALCMRSSAAAVHEVQYQGSLPFVSSIQNRLFSAYWLGETLCMDVFVLSSEGTSFKKLDTSHHVYRMSKLKDFSPSQLYTLLTNGEDFFLCASNGTCFSLRNQQVVGSSHVSFPKVDALAFDSSLNVVWAWNVLENTIQSWAHQSTPVSILHSSTRISSSLSTSPCLTMHVSEWVLSSLSRLTERFLLVKSPLNLAQTFCIICDHDTKQQHDDDGLNELVFQPVSSTLEYLAKLLVHMRNRGALGAVDSLLSLLFVNLHLLSCARNVHRRKIDAENGEWIPLLKAELFHFLPTSQLAFRVMVEAIPVFWPTKEEKVNVIFHSSVLLPHSLLMDALLHALAQQLLDMIHFFPVLRANYFSDTVFRALLVSPHERASELLSILFLSAILFAQKLFKNGSDAEGLKRRSSSTNKPSGEHEEEFEESKEDDEDSSSKRVLALGAPQPPVSVIDDFYWLAFELLEHCLSTQFQSLLARKVLPLVLIGMDNLLRDKSTQVKMTKSLLFKDLQPKTSFLAKFALALVRDSDTGSSSSPSSVPFTFSHLESMSTQFDIRSFTPPNVLEDRKLTVHIPFAFKLEIYFPETSSLRAGDSLVFTSGGNGGDNKQESVKFLAGDALPTKAKPLFFPHAQFEAIFASTSPVNGTLPSFAFSVTACRLIQQRCLNREWQFHLLDVTKKLLHTVLQVTTGSLAFPLSAKELELMRWIQNPLFSGGLAEERTSVPSSLKLKSSRSMNQLLLAEEANRLRVELLRYNSGLPMSNGSLSSSLLLGMRLPVNRVPFDAGLATQPAVCAMIAALIRTNGLDGEAAQFARQVMENPVGTVIRAPIRLRAVWSAAQLIRAWCDSLVVNGRVRRHFEACGLQDLVTSLPLDCEDREELEYTQLCDLIRIRCELISQVISPPPFLFAASMDGREDAKARWHFLRARFCPKTSIVVAQDPLLVVCRASLAMIKISDGKLPPSRNKHRRLSLTASTQDLLHSHLEFRTKRRASVSSIPPVLDETQTTINSVRPSRGSLPSNSFQSTSSGGVGGTDSPPPMLALSRKSSVVIESGVRVSSRAEGGLRRASLDNTLDLSSVVNVSQIEHDQTLSASVLSFVQSAMVLKKRDIFLALRTRNERAQARVHGFMLALCVFQDTDFRKREGRQLAESVITSVFQSLRLSAAALDANSQENGMEAHFFTDLSGCSLKYRERVSGMFLALLHCVCIHTVRVAKNFSFRMAQSQACFHLLTLLRSMELEYVESDFTLLYRAKVFDALHGCLSLKAKSGSIVIPEDAMVRKEAFHIFSRLFTRCVVLPHKQERANGLVAGHMFIQQLMDLLMTGIRSFWTLEAEKKVSSVVYLCHADSLYVFNSTFAASSPLYFHFTMEKMNFQSKWIPGCICSLGKDPTHDHQAEGYSWIEVWLNASGCIEVLVWKDQNVVLRITSLLKFARSSLKLAISFVDSRLHLFLMNETGSSHESVQALGGMMGGGVFLGTRPTMRNQSVQGVTLSQFVFETNLHAVDRARFFGSDVTGWPTESRLISNNDNPIHLVSDSPSEEESGKDLILHYLGLAHLALKSSSLVALKRLSTPEAQQLLLTLVLDRRCPLSVRVFSTRILKQVCPSFSRQLLEQFSACISAAALVSNTTDSPVMADPEAKLTMGSVMVDLIFYLCEMKSEWAMGVANFINHHMDHYVGSKSNNNAVSELYAALALCGANFEFLHVGGKALLNSNEVVHIVSTKSTNDNVMSQGKEAVDITRECTMDCSQKGIVCIEAPHGHCFTRIDVHPLPHLPIRNVTIFANNTEYSVQVNPLSPVFPLHFHSLTRSVRFEIQTYWTAVVEDDHMYDPPQVKCFGHPLATLSRVSMKTPREQLFVCRTTTTENDFNNDESEQEVHSSFSLTPCLNESPPRAVLEQLNLDLFPTLVQQLSHQMESATTTTTTNKKHNRIVFLDLLSRALKVICNLMPFPASNSSSPFSLVLSQHLSFWASLSKRHNAHGQPMPVVGRFKRHPVKESWQLRFALKSTQEDVVRFEPLATTTNDVSVWPHRFAVVDMSMTPVSKGFHSWTFTLLQDGFSRGDESVLFGMVSAHFPVGNAEVDLLLPHAHFRLLRAFDGSAIGASLPNPMLCVRVGDSVHCEWDVDKGSLSMAVNNRPFVCVFSDLGLDETWHPCVATYAEVGCTSEVVVSLSHCRSTLPPSRRRCEMECRFLSDVQVEALCSQSMLHLLETGEGHTVEEAAGSALTFVEHFEEDDDEEENELNVFHDVEEDDDKPGSTLQFDPSLTTLIPSTASTPPTTTVAPHCPALCQIDEGNSSNSKRAYAAVVGSFPSDDHVHLCNEPS